MSYKLTVCIKEKLERLVEVYIDCDAVEYVRRQYLEKAILLDVKDV